MDDYVTIYTFHFVLNISEYNLKSTNKYKYIKEKNYSGCTFCCLAPPHLLYQNPIVFKVKVKVKLYLFLETVFNLSKLNVVFPPLHFPLLWSYFIVMQIWV